jgi:hypothetical protein
MAGYIRQDTTNNIATGNVISAGDLDAEFDAVVGAFNNSTGHKHDGTAAEGAPITVIGPVQDVVVSAISVLPKTTSTLDLGSTSKKFKTAYIDTVNVTTATIATATITALSAPLAVTSGGTGVTTSTGTGSTVLSASPTFTGGSTTPVTINGYIEVLSSITVDDDVLVYGNVYTDHSTSYTKTAATTLVSSEVLGGHLVYTGVAGTLTLPTGTSIYSSFANSTFRADSTSNGFCFELSIINTGSGTVTIGTATGLTLVGAMTIPINTSGTLRFQKTATNTFTVLRIA